MEPMLKIDNILKTGFHCAVQKNNQQVHIILSKRGLEISIEDFNQKKQFYIVRKYPLPPR